jgi:hypothetical protein
LGQRRWSFNLVTNYSFSKEGPLDGWSVGAAGRWRDNPVIGYAVNSNGEFVNNEPFYGKQQTIVNSWIGHRLKLKTLAIDFRLGIDNVLNENEPYLYRAVDDGSGNAAETVRMKPTERTFTFTTSIKF